jgi:hypothetical protein
MSMEQHLIIAGTKEGITDELNKVNKKVTQINNSKETKSKQAILVAGASLSIITSNPILQE